MRDLLNRIITILILSYACSQVDGKTALRVLQNFTTEVNLTGTLNRHDSYECARKVEFEKWLWIYFDGGRAERSTNARVVKNALVANSNVFTLLGSVKAVAKKCAESGICRNGATQNSIRRQNFIILAYFRIRVILRGTCFGLKTGNGNYEGASCQNLRIQRLYAKPQSKF